MRADALRNRRRILDAARDVFLQHGLNAPLDMIVRRAGVGPGTLYRRYSDREALVRDLTGDLLARLEIAAKAAAAADHDAFAALRRFLHEAADIRMGAVIPILLEGLVVDKELIRVRTSTAEAVEGLVEAAHQSGQLRRDVGMGDLVLLSIRLSRPLPDGLNSLDPDGELLHRHLDLALDGLRTTAAAESAANRTLGSPLAFDGLIAAANRPSVADRP